LIAYLNGTEYDAENKLAKIGPGSNWGEAFTVLDEFGVAAVGGRASVVGVGGFTTGSGVRTTRLLLSSLRILSLTLFQYSFHSNRRGFACDNVANFEVVLADGSVVNANADEHADLWKALKGGSGNLGFVTRIDTRKWQSSMLNPLGLNLG
jgi:FAD/FMN-containing dehydrogenase